MQLQNESGYRFSQLENLTQKQVTVKKPSHVTAMDGLGELHFFQKKFIHTRPHLNVPCNSVFIKSSVNWNEELCTYTMLRSSRTVS